MNSWLKTLAIAGLALCASSTDAQAQTQRELTTFVYPQSANNTYRLPQYVLKGKPATGLSRCGKTKVEGLRFEPDGQTFHLDPAPPSFKTPFRRTVRVRRGKSSCFKAEVRVVVPILGDPEPSTWVIEWSPNRPNAIDVVVPSAQLAADADMRAAHRLEFPAATSNPQGDWTDCTGTCRWRIVADGSVRRDFLTRPVIPVKVAAQPLTGLGSRSGIIDPATGSIRPRPATVALSKWKIAPNIFRSVKVRADQSEVTLEFPGAWALKPTPPDQEDPQLIHTASGPVLRFSDTSGRKAFELTPGGGQLKAYLTLDVEGQTRQFLSYIARFGSTRVRMPPDMKVCDPQPKTLYDMGAVGASMFRPLPFIRGSTRCRKPSGQLRITLLAPILRASDIESMALDWHPQHPNRIDIYVRSKAVVQSSAIREDTELTVGDHPPGQWLNCFAKYCQYRIEGFSGASGLLTPTVGIRSKRLQAERSGPLDAVTGLPFQPQQVEVKSWRVAEPVTTVGVPFLDGDGSAVGTINEPVARFFKPGPVACTASGTCTIDPNEGTMAVRVSGREAIRVSTISVPAVATPDISLVHVRGELWRPVKAQMRLKLSTCRYKVRQLSRAIAGLNEATVLYQARLLPGSSASCPGQDWSAALDTGERGHAQFSNGLLEVYLESIPRPGEGGSGVVNLNLSYPTGQVVRIEEGAKLAIEPAPNVGPPRVSVRLPGGDLRPLATTLAVDRPNILYFDMIDEPLDWGVELVRARSLYRPCRNDSGNVDNEGPTDFSDDESYGSYCIVPNERTTDTLKLRFVRQGETKLLLRTGVDPAILPAEEQAKFRRIGWVEIETGRPAQPWSIAMNLGPVTQLHCGDRIVPPNAGPTPRAVNYDDFEHCEVWVELKAPARAGPEDATPQEDALAFFGDQKIEVRGRLLSGDDTAGSKVLTSVRLRAETETRDQKYLIIPVSLAEIGTNPPEDYDVVEVEVAHAAGFYATDDKWSSPQSVARLKVRRGPEYLAWWSDSGRGARVFAAFTAVPFSLFRYPHSGKGVTTSDALDELEKANVALGIAGILEAWNFDYNESIIPVINPQLQIGALVSSNPTSGDLSLPGISLIAGLGLRTGVGTSPGKGVESSLKTVIWYEMLFQRDGRGNDPSHNLLFGFTVDLGSTPN